MAHFMGLADTKVPWATNVNFGHYDWRYYKFNKTMSSKSSKMGANGNGVGTFISDVFEPLLASSFICDCKLNIPFISTS